MCPAFRPSPRMKPKPGGLFDTGATGVSKASRPALTSVDSVDFSFADDSLAMYAALEKGAIGEGSDAVSMATPLMSTASDCSDLLSLDGDFDFIGNADLCEVFTDLTQILQAEGQEDMAMAIDTDPLPAIAPQPTAGRQAVKRRASEALPGADLAPSVNPDHNDYTSKDKRRKISASATATLTAAMVVDAVTMATADEPSSTEKYHERRRKNNIASKRSRETRKQKHSVLEQTAIDLEAENKALRLKVEQLEKLAQEMKDTLVQKLAHGK